MVTGAPPSDGYFQLVGYHCFVVFKNTIWALIVKSKRNHFVLTLEMHEKIMTNRNSEIKLQLNILIMEIEIVLDMGIVVLVGANVGRIILPNHLLH